ncbi:MAG: adenylate/guanylate cyclase domain-containing protein [Patescibacteria group bacterium]
MKLVNQQSDWRRPLIVGLAAGAVCGLLAWTGAISSWSHRLEDRLYQPVVADPRVVIIAIDDAAMARLGRWPWARSVHAQVIEKISQAQPLAIGYDVNFPETSDQANDAALASAIQAAGKVVLPAELTLSITRNVITYDPSKVLMPISQIAVAAAGIGHVNTPQDVDGVVRRVPVIASSPDGSKLKSFEIRLTELAGIAVDPNQALDSLGRIIIHYVNAPEKGFPTYSAADLMDDKVQASALKDRIVMVGATAADLHDDQLVPTSFNQPMSGVEIHSSILDTLLKGNYLREVPGWALFVYLVLLGALLGLVLPKLRPRYSIPLVIVVWLANLIGAFYAFDRGWIMDVLWPTILLLVGFGAVTLERRVASEQQKREIKNAFSRYVSSSVVNSILSDMSKLHLGGERRRMTVLFSDIRGFTTISEGLKPEKMVEIMNIYLSRMTNIVFKYDGVLDKYIGDAVMAFWNAPLDQTDHAKRAVQTGLDMLAELKEMNAAKAFGDLEIKIGVGVNTGDMVVGNMGSEERFDYTVIGDSVNLGSRMEALTKEYGVAMLISESTKDALNGGFLLRLVDLVAVKGKKVPVKMYEVIKKTAKATQQDKDLVAQYEDAIKDYFAKDFSSAIQKIQSLLQKYPTDGPSKTLLERAQHFQSNPPPADWDGAWVMTKK